MERKELPVWLGLEHLDSVAEQVKAGTWVQPQVVYHLDEFDPLSQEDLVLIEKFMAAPIVLPKRTSGLAKTQGNYRAPSTDYDALANSLKGLKL